MARFNKGVLGGFSGKVGPVVGGSWNGIDYIRSLPTIKKNRQFSEEQDIQRAKFSAAANFLKALQPLLMTTFKDGNKMTGHNAALSYTLKNAVVGVYPDISIDYSLTQVARGTLPNAITPAAVSADAEKIRFSWGDNTGVGTAKPTDKVILVAYHPASLTPVYTMGAAKRSDGTAQLALPGMSGKEVETWIAFMSEKGKDVSSSVYTGRITVS
jgi:hypothetical protein